MYRKKMLIYFLIVFTILFSSFFIFKSYATYNSNVISSGLTDIAKWELLSLGDNNQTIDLLPGGNSTSYLLKITSNSEVSSSYSIKISNLPDTVRVSLDDREFVAPVNSIVIFENSGHFSATSNIVKQHILSFKAIDGANSVLNREIDIDIVMVQDSI